MNHRRPANQARASGTTLLSRPTVSASTSARFRGSSNRVLSTYKTGLLARLKSESSALLPHATSTRARLQALTIKQQLELGQISASKAAESLQDLNALDRHELDHLPHDDGDPLYIDIPLDNSTIPDSDDDVDQPGFSSRAGQNFRVLTDDILGPHYTVKHIRSQGPDRAEQLKKNAELWSEQYPSLVPLYLHWKHNTPKIDPPPPPPPPPSLPYFTVDMIAWHQRDTSFPIPQVEGATFASESLIRQGLLSNSPTVPTYAFSLLTLETFRRLRLRTPRLSVQSFLKAICDSQNDIYHAELATPFAEALDVYLAILRIVDSQVAKALNRDSPQWRINNVCPPCTYKLIDEPALRHDILLAIDGGNSLKRFANAGTASDGLTFTSDYFVSREDVDIFAKESTSSNGKKGKGTSRKPKKSMEEEDHAAEEHAEDMQMELSADTAEDGNVANQEFVVKNLPIGEGADEAGHLLGSCTERWKANADDAQKKAFNCFEETGIFACLCRHGHVLAVADMVSSGELAKYPLAVLDKVNTALGPGKRLIAYDIGCTFKKTIAKSALGDNLDADYTIPAMHGYAHNRLCQCSHHPKYVAGTGLEDFETCERFFSVSNDCARVTRHATRFHRHQLIHMFLCQWDEDKLLSSAKFIRNNYIQALAVLRDNALILQKELVSKNFTEEMVQSWLEEESTYLSGLVREPEHETMTVGYVEALQALASAEAELEHERKNGGRVVPGEADPMKRHIRPTFKKSESKVQDLTEVVNEYEADLDIRGPRWRPGMPEYKKVVKYAQQRKYHLALDQLERLLVQRLFELQKGHLEGTGYKLRTHIAKHLKKRSETVRTALKAYNTAAGAIGAEKLDFKTVINYAFVSQFDLLRDARQDIRSKPWAQASNRFLMDKLFERDHAREEIVRLNVEVARLRTWICDEDHDFRSVINAMQETNPNLTSEIQEQAQRRFRIHERLLKTLQALERTAGFTGTRTPGQSITKGNATASPSDHSLSQASSVDQPDSRLEPMDGDSDIDADEDHLDRAVHALSNMI
ncbi:hypothetical protein M407DRAFT_11467 [Tulasnella calospora MUT 4182]|uniref:CxC1-like cysteine cluster associated with KDZ transposases domain-containing protein n=1 Tax=Tulasnella calospora MUT 4182 TaxID=1051891 RepID=A0A0C3Q745_9AGAM|nr:hypothetical protein M407DRAFT_11467 [Tulasnella calospora MUT 4182]